MFTQKAIPIKRVKLSTVASCKSILLSLHKSGVAVVVVVVVVVVRMPEYFYF